LRRKIFATLILVVPEQIAKLDLTGQEWTDLSVLVLLVTGGILLSDVQEESA